MLPGRGGWSEPLDIGEGVDILVAGYWGGSWYFGGWKGGVMWGIGLGHFLWEESGPEGGVHSGGESGALHSCTGALRGLRASSSTAAWLSWEFVWAITACAPGILLGHLQSQQATTASTRPAVAQTVLSKAPGLLLIVESFLAWDVGPVLLQGPGNSSVLAGQASLQEMLKVTSILYSGSIAWMNCGLTDPAGTLSFCSACRISSFPHQLEDVLVLAHRELLYQEMSVEPGWRAVSTMSLGLLEFRNRESFSRNKPTLFLSLRKEE